MLPASPSASVLYYNKLNTVLIIDFRTLIEKYVYFQADILFHPELYSAEHAGYLGHFLHHQPHVQSKLLQRDGSTHERCQATLQRPQVCVHLSQIHNSDVISMYTNKIAYNSKLTLCMNSF